MHLCLTSGIGTSDHRSLWHPIVSVRKTGIMFHYLQLVQIAQLRRTLSYPVIAWTYFKYVQMVKKSVSTFHMEIRTWPASPHLGPGSSLINTRDCERRFAPESEMFGTSRIKSNMMAALPSTNMVTRNESMACIEDQNVSDWYVLFFNRKWLLALLKPKDVVLSESNVNV